MSHNPCQCGNGEEVEWPSKTGTMICQECWETECDAAWRESYELFEQIQSEMLKIYGLEAE